MIVDSVNNAVHGNSKSMWVTANEMRLLKRKRKIGSDHESMKSLHLAIENGKKSPERTTFSNKIRDPIKSRTMYLAQSS